MQTRINEMVKKTYQYFYIDGLPELTSGSMFLLAGLWLVFMALVENPTTIAMLSAVCLPVLIIGGVFVQNRMLRALKERITYPRTGYVDYRRGRPDRKRWVLLATIFLVSFIGIFIPDTWYELPLGIGIILGLIHFYLGYRLSIRRFYFAGVVAVMVGILSATMLPNEVLGVGLVFLVTGLTLVTSGGWVFMQYIRSHPVVNEVA